MSSLGGVEDGTDVTVIVSWALSALNENRKMESNHLPVFVNAYIDLIFIFPELADQM